MLQRDNNTSFSHKTSAKSTLELISPSNFHFQDRLSSLFYIKRKEFVQSHQNLMNYYYFFIFNHIKLYYFSCRTWWTLFQLYIYLRHTSWLICWPSLIYIPPLRKHKSCNLWADRLWTSCFALDHSMLPSLRFQSEYW